MHWDITDAIPTDYLTLSVTFTDGLCGHMKFSPSHLQGVFARLKNPVFFNQVSVKKGVVTWPGGLNLDPDTLYDEIKQRWSRSVDTNLNKGPLTPLLNTAASTNFSFNGFTKTFFEIHTDLFPASEFTNYRRALSEHIANEILFKRYPNRNRRMDIHVINTVINRNAETLSLIAVADDHSVFCALRASEMQETFIAEFKKQLTARHLIEMTVDKLLVKLRGYVKLLNEATSEKDQKEIQEAILILFDPYGEDKKTFCERSLFDNTILEKSKYILSRDIRDILIVTLTRRLINSAYLEVREIQTFEDEKGIFYRLRSFPESSFFISKSNEVNNLLDSVSILVKEGKTLPQAILEILPENFSNRLIAFPHQIASTTRAYLSLLNQLIKTNALKKEILLKMLTQQTPKGWTLSMLIARDQDAEIMAYLSQLLQLIETHALEKKDLLKILTQQTQDGWTLSILIAREQNADTTISYLFWLRQLIERHILEKEDLSTILTQEIKDRLTFGMMLARYQDATTTIHYLSWLPQLIEAQILKKEDLLKMLTQQTENGWTLGMIIAKHQDDATTTIYLSWLLQFIETHLIEKEDLLKILTQQNQNGWALGIIIAEHQDATTTTRYLFLLAKVIEEPNTLKKKDLLEMLTQQYQDGWTLGMMIACNQNPTTTIAYLSCLNELIKTRRLDKEDLFKILNQQTIERKNLYYMIWTYQNITSQQQFNDLISKTEEMAEETEKEKRKIQEEQGLSLQEANLWLEHKQIFREKLFKLEDSTPLSCDDIRTITNLSADKAIQFDQKTKLLQGMLKIDVMSAVSFKSKDDFQFRNEVIYFLENGAERYHYLISEKATLYAHAAQSARARSGSTFFKSETTRFFEGIAQEDRRNERQASQEYTG